jgi:hypothetical protein
MVFSGSEARMHFATDGAHQLEDMYIEDCKINTRPHGYYAAFLQACEFSFYHRSSDDDHNNVPAAADVCTDPSSTLVGQPKPMNWFFNMTDEFQKQFSSSSSSDDSSSSSSDSWDDKDWEEIAQKLLFWPDQCVGVLPRCYTIGEDARILEVLHRVIDDIPDAATHVQVNCQADAMELSRVVYAFADGFEKSAPTIIAWLITVCLFAIVALAWCSYACFRLCHGPPRREYHAVTATPVPEFAYASFKEEETKPLQAKTMYQA